MSICIHVYMYICIYVYIYIYVYTGRTKVALVELPPVNMLDFFLCTKLSPWNPSTELCRTPVEFPTSKGF